MVIMVEQPVQQKFVRFNESLWIPGGIQRKFTLFSKICGAERGANLPHNEKRT